MRVPKPVFRLRSRAAAALLLLGLSACTSWRVYEPGPVPLLSQDPAPRQVEVFRREARSLKLTQPRLAGDSVYGMHSDTAVAIPLADVTHVKERRRDVLGSLLVGTGATFGSLAALFFVALYASFE